MFQRTMYRLHTLLLATLILTGCGDRATTPNTSQTIPSDTAAPSTTDTPSDSTKSTDANVKPELTTEQIEFGNKWKAGSQGQRRTMADLAKVHPLFEGGTKSQIKAAFGPAAETGIDKFGEDVMRYELGDLPEADGGGKYHLTFVFKNDVVIRVMGNFISISP